MDIPLCLGKKIEDIVCDDCKEKLKEATSNLTKYDIFLFRRTANRFVKLLCNECKIKVRRRLKHGSV